MNLEEGFRRVGVATYWIAVMLALLAFFGTANLLFAFLVGLAVIILFHIGIYVVKGFIKQAGTQKKKD